METETESVEQTELEQHSSQDESNFLNSLDEQDFDPSEVQAEQQTNQVDIEAAQAIVCIGLMTVESTLKSMLHKDFQFDADQAENVASKVAPLIVKYGVNPPPWLAKYMDEIMAVFAIGMLGLASFMQVKNLKAIDVKAARKAANDDNAEAQAA